ncbi:MAG: DAK2 domain-containing protein, partial [Dehalococcoidales bacterium]|nr:DAK2 domain-containing protein [Dehalococcoidales bacterium]
KVVPTQTKPKGVAAHLTFDYEAYIETNARLMSEARATVKTIEITRAVRSAKLDGLDIKKNQTIGLLDGELLAAGNNEMDILNKILAKLDLNKTEIITIYYGANIKPAEAEKVSTSIRQKYPRLQVEVVRGGQPHYTYIVSIE